MEMENPKMGYYDFNDNFWSPKIVYSQTASSQSNSTHIHSQILSRILTIVCFAVWTFVLLNIWSMYMQNQRTTSSQT